MIPIDIHLNLAAGAFAVLGASAVFGALVSALQRNWDRNAEVVQIPVRRRAEDEAGHAAA